MHHDFLGLMTNSWSEKNMQTTTGQKVFSIPALLLLSFVTSARLSVEKMSTPRAGLSTLRRSCGTPQPCSAEPRTAKTLMIASWYGKKFQGRRTSSGGAVRSEQVDSGKQNTAAGQHGKTNCPGNRSISGSAN